MAYVILLIMREVSLHHKHPNHDVADLIYKADSILSWLPARLDSCAA